jgi:hypothetical protein
VENLFEERSLLILGYLSGISMCDHPEKNPCTYIKYCIDLEGVVSCACPEGMSGDGRKKGSGCYFGSQKHFPLDTVLGNFLNTYNIYHMLTTLRQCTLINKLLK